MKLKSHVHILCNENCSPVHYNELLMPWEKKKKNPQYSKWSQH